MSVSQAGVETFHAHLNAQQYPTIYAESSPEFQKSASEREITEFFEAIHRKLGAVVSSKQDRFLVNFTTAGTIVTLNYSTKFESGDGEETFVWMVSDDKAQLLHYNVESRALITK